MSSPCIAAPLAAILCAFGGAGFAWAQTSCPPPGFQAPAATQPSPMSADKGRIDVYIDASGSMSGFVKRPVGKVTSQSKRLYPDFVLGVRRFASRMTLTGNDAVTFYQFGKRIQELNGDSIRLFAEPGVYSCRPLAPGTQCDKDDSRIGEVFAKAAAAPADTLSIIVTDLFVSDDDLSGPNARQLFDPLTDVLRSGRSLAFLLVRSSFVHTPVYEMPSRKQYHGATDLTFAVVLVGPIERIQRFEEILQAEFFAGAGIPAQDRRSLVFTTRVVKSPLLGAAWPEAAFSSPKGALPRNLFRRGLFPPEVKLQQFEMRRGFVPLEARIPWTSIILKDSLKPDEIAIERHSLSLLTSDNGSQKCEGRWTPFTPRGPALVIRSQHDHLVFRLFEDPALYDNLPKGRIALLSYSVTARNLRIDDEAWAWIREWSFDAASEDTLVKRRATFIPILNFEHLMKRLEAVLRDMIKEPIPLAQFSVGIRTTD